MTEAIPQSVDTTSTDMQVRRLDSLLLFWLSLWGITSPLYGIIFYMMHMSSHRMDRYEASYGFTNICVPFIFCLLCGLAILYYGHLFIIKFRSKDLSKAIGLALLTLLLAASLWQWQISSMLMVEFGLLALLLYCGTWSLAICQLLGKQSLRWKLGLSLLKLIQQLLICPLLIVGIYLIIVILQHIHPPTPNSTYWLPATVLFVLLLAATIACFYLSSKFSRKAAKKAREILGEIPNNQSGTSSA